MALRPYQLDLKREVYQAWNQGARNVVMRLDTGGGKTVVIADITREHEGASAIIAHRQELVSQLSHGLAREGLRHNLVAAEKTRRAIVAGHMEDFGRSYYEPGARCAVASVDTLVRAGGLESWFGQVTSWTTDEGHHVVRGNKWDSVIQRFTNPSCRGLLPTATPSRADGKGLGRHADGLADAMVQGPPMRWLIDQGFLTDYRIICPPSDLLSKLDEVGPSGDWTQKQLKEAAHQSQIVGDVVKSYLTWARGKRNITFATDINTAVLMAQSYRAAGVRAETLTGLTEGGLRRAILRRFAAGEIDVICAVDIISEGFDLPAVESVTFARPTESLGLYMQQFGRALRAMLGKQRAIIIDHVRNVIRHLAPDRPRPWTLDRREGKGRSTGGVGLRVCLNPACYEPFENFRSRCPHCGEPIPEPESRGSVEHVAGDLTELDENTLAALRGEVELVDRHHDFVRADAAAKFVPPIGQMRLVNLHVARQDAQTRLREVMGWFGGVRHAAGYTDAEIQREFWMRYRIDVLTAQTLGAARAEELRAKIEGSLYP